MADTTLRDGIQAAEADIATGHPEAALDRCQQLQASFPRALVIQRVLGEVYLAQRKPREALAALERALEGDPEDARACCARALVHQIHGDSSAALAWYRRACDIRPEDAMLRDAYRELAAHLQQPPYRPTTFGLARLYVRGALFTHAEREWQTILAEQPDRLDAQVGLAETLWRAGDDARAADLAQRIVTNTGTCVKALLIVAALEHAGGRDDETNRLLQRAAELDPERRIGQALYADRFASGDLTLRRLFLGAEEDAVATTTPHRPTAGATPSSDVDEAPTQRMAVPGNARSQLPGGTGPLSPFGAGTQPDLDEFSAFAQSRTTPIPPNFHQIFAETEFMLWGREDEGGRAAGAAERAPATGPKDSMTRSRGERFERSSVSASPALPSPDGEPQDTDTRTSIGWVRWLQAQGARPIDGAERPPVARAVEKTGPLTPTQQSLRTMFAELDPAPGGEQATEDNAVAPAAPPKQSSAQSPGDAAETPAAANVSSAAPPEASADTTLEALEQRFAASGFRPIDLHPGTLMDAAPGGDAQHEQAHAAAPVPEPQGGDETDPAREPTPETADADPPHTPPTWGVSLPVPPSASAEQTAPAPDEANLETAPAADDYISRIQLARRRRAEGRLDEALVEYRGVLRDSPATLDDLIHDLRDLSASTENPEVHRLLADAYIREGNYMNAIESYNRALALTQGQDG